MQELIQVFGRFHPLVLHAPIGMLGAMAIIELLGLKRPDESVRRVFCGLAWLTTLAAVVAVASGWVLEREGGYDQVIVDRHFNLGIATAVLSTLLAVSSHFKSHASPRRGLLVLALLVLVPTGHFGASMTHGEDFLLEPLAKRNERLGPAEVNSGLPAMRESPVASVSTASLTGEAAAPSAGASPDLYSKEIAPILADMCLKCHGTSKKKGGLSLHTPDLIRLGGDGGAVMVPGKPEESEMLLRLRLPLDDEDHMPPEGKPQPGEAQIATIEAWIRAGAPMPGASAATSPDASSATASSAPVEPAKPTGPAPASAEAIAAIRGALVHIEPMAADSTLLVVSFNAIAPTVDDALVARLLMPIKDNLADLSLGRTKITDASAEFLAAMPRLRRLDLRATPITPGAVEKLAASESLEDLVLAQTKLSDDVVATIGRMEDLARVYLWGAGLSAEGIARLRSERPELEVDAGDRLVTENLGPEAELKFTSDAPLPGVAIAAPASLEPINKVCPVSGDPINPKYLVLYDGKVIGFCCPNCPKTFWADPEKCLAGLKK